MTRALVLLVLLLAVLDLAGEDECDPGDAPDCTVCVGGCV